MKVFIKSRFGLVHIPLFMELFLISIGNSWITRLVTTGNLVTYLVNRNRNFGGIGVLDTSYQDSLREWFRWFGY